MYNTGEIRYPLDTIQFVSGKARIVDFLNYLFKNAIDFDKKMKQEKGEDFFPVLRYNSVGFLYEIECEFFVEIYIKYAVEFYRIDEESQVKMKHYLLLSLDNKIREARYMFFVIVLGNYYRLGDKYFGDYCKNKYQLFVSTIIQNKSGDFAHARYIPIRNFVDENLIIEEEILDKIKSENYKMIVFGAKKVKSFIEENSSKIIEKIYFID